MKKINKLSLVLASALVLGAITGCGQSTSYIEQVGSVSDFKVKAYPGANYLTWAPSEVSNGYTIFRDGEFVTTVGNRSTSFWDYINPSIEWSDGQEVKYTIQNNGRDLARSATEADTVIGSSAFAEATVKAINPGYKSEVMYKIPALEEGKALPNFADFDYTNAEELAKLVEPKATITEREDKDALISMAKIPYLNTKIWVASEDETEKMSFGFNKDLNFSKLGTAIVPPAFIGKNVIWAEFSDANGYYESKKVKLAEFEKEALGGNFDFDFSYNNVTMTYDSEEESYKIEWDAPIYKVTGEYVTDWSYSLYYQPTYNEWEKVVLTPVFNEISGKYESLIDIPSGRKYTPWRFFVSNSDGFVFVEYVYNDLTGKYDKPVAYKEGGIPNVSVGNYSVNCAVTKKDKDGLATEIALVWDPATVSSEVSDKVTYKIVSSTWDPLAEEWSDSVAFDATINAYDEKTGKMTTASFDVPKNNTKYSVIAYFEGRKQNEATTEYYASNTYNWGRFVSYSREGKTVEVEVYSSTEAKSPVKNSYVVYYMPSGYNPYNVLDLAVAKKVECSAKWEEVPGDTTVEKGTFEFDFDDKDESYNVWLFEVNGDAFSTIVDGYTIYTI
ncbi:MAG: hypothetical protein IJZ71_04560 [Treponema sp.]|nr:hypothetical protein [Treponema sp.]